MQVIDAQDVHRVLTFPRLIDALRGAFAAPAGTPRRSVYPLAEGSHDAFAVLPAWNDEAIGVKAFTYLPGNAAAGRPILHSKILLFERESGAPLALVDGTSVTWWRTAAMAGLAADYLARPDARRLLVCGTGLLAPFMVRAHAAVRPYADIAIWGRDPVRAAATVAALRVLDPALPCRMAGTLEAEAREADVISCATASREPLILGDWVRPGTHTDFFGNHDREARECDTALVLKASLHVDSRANVLQEAGELLIPIAEGVLREEAIRGELADLCAGRVSGRRSAEEVTLFKSVGTALSDLAAAHLVVRAQ